jgi:hypothetical protein
MRTDAPKRNADVRAARRGTPVAHHRVLPRFWRDAASRPLIPRQGARTMRRFNKQLIAVAAASALTAVIGVAWAQATQEPSDTPPAVVNSGKDAQILFFKDQGNSPETDPAAHLSLVKEGAPQPMAAAEPAPQVAEATPAPAPAAEPAPAPEPAPAAAEPSTNNDMSSHTDYPAPKADRN